MKTIVLAKCGVCGCMEEIETNWRPYLIEYSGFACLECIGTMIVIADEL